MTLALRQFLSAAAALVLAGCATTTNLRIQRAPEIDLPGVRSLWVEPMPVSGGLDLDQVSAGGGLLGAVVDVAVNVGTNVAASRQDSRWTERNAADLRGAVVRNGTFEVHELSGADAVLKGTGEYDVKDKGEQVQEKIDGKTVRSYQLERTATARVRFEVVDPQGKILGAGEVVGERRDKVEEDDADQARGKVAGWEDLVRQAFADAHEKLVTKIAPYYVSERRTFAKGDAKAVKEGNKRAAKGDWDGALARWRSSLQGSRLDRAASLHNLAIWQESRGELDSALALYQESKSVKSLDGIGSSIARVQSRIEERARLQAAAAARAKPAAP